MIRVLHYACPEEARRRIAFLGVSGADADRLVGDLRAWLIGVPLDSGPAETLPALLERHAIACARGARTLLFSVSSGEQVRGWMNGKGASERTLLPVVRAIDRYRAREFAVPCRGRTLDLAGIPRIMGILNVTPDSFSDGGRYASPDEAVKRGIAMAEEGADVIDVGGESTRPGSAGVPPDEELRRVLPVVRGLTAATNALLSIDTTKAAVARAAAEAGAHIVNDTSALAADPMMAEVVRETGMAVVLMHRRGTPATMQVAPHYDSLFDEVLDELATRIAAARNAGIPEERILVDPGIGFGKRLEDNMAFHRHAADLRNLGRPVVFGPSRKAFIGALTGKDAQHRVFGTCASVALAAAAGAHVIRVHDVAEMRDAVRVAGAIGRGAEC